MHSQGALPNGITPEGVPLSGLGDFHRSARSAVSHMPAGMCQQLAQLRLKTAASHLQAADSAYVPGSSLLPAQQQQLAATPFTAAVRVRR
jgi:hypothetical protein